MEFNKLPESFRINGKRRLANGHTYVHGWSRRARGRVKREPSVASRQQSHRAVANGFQKGRLRERGGAPLRRHRRANNNRPRTTLEQDPARVLSRDERTAHGRKNTPETIVYDTSDGETVPQQDSELIALSPSRGALSRVPTPFPRPRASPPATSTISSHRVFIEVYKSSTTDEC